jgi:hypothetical protein
MRWNEGANACQMLGTETQSTVEMERQQQEARIQEAVYVLNRAREIRADAALMASIRAYLRKVRDDGAELLDSLGA